MKKVFIISAIVLLSGINFIIFSQRSENPLLSLNSVFTIANANAETGNTKTLVVTTTKESAQVELCGEVAASWLKIASFSGCITVSIERSVETHTCPSPGSTC